MSPEDLACAEGLHRLCDTASCSCPCHKDGWGRTPIGRRPDEGRPTKIAWCRRCARDTLWRGYDAPGGRVKWRCAPCASRASSASYARRVAREREAR